MIVPGLDPHLVVAESGSAEVPPVLGFPTHRALDVRAWDEDLIFVDDGDLL
jgi:hypothetical protein